MMGDGIIPAPKQRLTGQAGQNFVHPACPHGSPAGDVPLQQTEREKKGIIVRFQSIRKGIEITRKPGDARKPTARET